jgi:thiamine-monophosphate kinase
MAGEFELISKLKRQISSNLQGLIGIGDDAGIFPGTKTKYLFTTDTIVETIDFERRKAKPEEIGRKALAINLSDIAAMGGVPKAFVVTLGIPEGFSSAWLEKCYAGMMRLAREYKVSCLGGDITRAKELFLTIALIGESGKKVFLRSGAQTGDSIGVTGTLGGSILGKQFHFTPRIHEALFLSKFKIHAAIDVSDGLVQDLEHLLKNSKKGAAIHLDALPVSGAASKLPGNALNHALSDGEDFELLFTLPRSQVKAVERAWKKRFPKVQLSWIGQITKDKGLRWVQNGKQIRFQLKKKGYTHFS